MARPSGVPLKPHFAQVDDKSMARAFTQRLQHFVSLAVGGAAGDALTAAAGELEGEFESVVCALEERRALLERLSNIQQSITLRADLGTTLDAVVAGAAELLGEPIAGVRLLDSDDPTSVALVSAVGLTAEQRDAMRRSPLGTGAGGRAISDEQLVVVESYQDAPDMTEAVRSAGVQAAMAAPVREQGRVVGSLAVASPTPGRTFSEYERAALLALAEHASIALTDARMVADAMHQAVHDALTGLPNRTLFADRVEHALGVAKRRKTRVAVLFCDLDHFKVVNDSLGHHTGDKLLVLVAQRLREALRSTDTVARFGGDEFGILLEGIATERDAMRVAEEIAMVFRAPFRLPSGPHVVSASIGIALSTTGVGGAEELVRDADAAMYRAKLRGRNGYEVFDEAMRLRAVERMRVERELRTALAEDQLRIVFQPIVSLEDGQPVGAEALVRWQHPERGLLGPGEFIPVAEESGLIVGIGEWVLAEAAREAATWPGELTVSVNLSPRQVNPRLVEAVASALANSGLAPDRLALEITEGVLLEDSDMAHGTLKALKALGPHLVLDDFGTGFSSLGYLKRLPLDGLKIDRSFVAGLGSDPDDTAIVSAVAGMAASLGLTLIAEGVETLAHVRALRELSCQRAQGFHFARPMDPIAFRALIAPDRRRRNSIPAACFPPLQPSTR